jgi:thioredoxin reductase (NADPH)
MNPRNPMPLFIALEGSVSISRTGEDDKILAVREANQFTSEMSFISGKRSLLKARVAGDGCDRARRSLLRFKGSDS